MNFGKKWKRFCTFSRKHEGFTLVELIVVIAIMAILAGVAVPAYTGYINKANKASDLQLLGAVNTAFGAAVMEDLNMSTSQLPDGYASFSTDSMTVSGDHQASFDKYFAGNANSEFKVIKLVAFKGGVFVEASEAYAGLIGGFSATDIENFNKGAFADIGFNALLGQVDMATQIALAADPNSTLGKLVFDQEAYMATMATYLGYDLTKEGEADKFAAALQTMTTEKVNQLIAAGADASSDEAMDALYAQANKEIMANTAVLNAATNTTFDTDAFKTQLAAGKGKDTIKGSMDGETGNTVALAQTAMAYAMYTSYMERNGGTASSNYMEVLDVLETQGFKDYMATDNATTDMNSYLAAMNMVKDTSGNTDAVSSLLVNGFNDADLSALLNQEISAKKTTN